MRLPRLASPIAAVLIAFALAASSAVADPNDATYDGIVTDSAALPRGGTVRFMGSGGTFGSADGLSGELGVSWTMIPTLAFRVDGVMENGATALADKFALVEEVHPHDCSQRSARA